MVAGVAGVIRRAGSGPILSGSLARQVLAWNATDRTWDPTQITVLVPGAPAYDVRDFGAVGDGVADDTAAINAAIAAANAVPGAVYLMPRHRITAALTTIANNNIMLIGRGEFNSGTWLTIDAAVLPSAVITVGASQYSGVQGVWCTSTRASTSGFFVRCVGAYRPYLANVQVSGYGNGFEIDRCVGTYLKRCQVNDTYGSYCYYAHGSNPDFCHDTSFDMCGCGTSYSGAVVGTPGAWATATAYVVGNVVVANGGIWRCVTAGTSAGAGTGPGSAGLPSTSTATVHTTTVIDGTAGWRFEMGAFAGFVHGSFAHTVTLIKCGVLQGLIGLDVIDDAPAAGSIPTFNHSWQFSSDHTLSRGVRVGGAAVWFDQLLVTSILGGDGVEITTASSGVEITSGQVFGIARNGVTLAGTGGTVLGHLDIGPCSSQTANTYDGIAVANNAGNFKVHDCTSGDVTGFASGARYGISIGTGCDNFIVENNKFVGNDTAPILCNVARTTTRIIRNNIPEQAYYDATDGVYKVTLAAGVQSLTLPAGTHTVICTMTGGAAAIVNEIIHPDALSTLNSGIRLRFLKEGFASTGTLAFRDGNASQNSIWTPNSQDYVLSRFNDEVDIQQLQTAQLNSVRWRVLNRSLPTATISVNVPVVAAGTLAYLDVSVAGSALDGITTADQVLAAPTADLAAAGAGAGYYVGCRVSATNTVRLTFQGTLAGGAVNFTFSKQTFTGP
jgi:hypothetical protein